VSKQDICRKTFRKRDHWEIAKKKRSEEYIWKKKAMIRHPYLERFLWSSYKKLSRPETLECLKMESEIARFQDMQLYAVVKGILHLWKDECICKMVHLCRRNVKWFLNLELSRLRKARKCIFGLCGWK